jgi:ubiquinone/menaquinone biosynthesis C-methylase UbiE
MNIQDTLRQTSDYWNLRAEGYSQTINEELSGPQKDDWTTFFQKHAPAKDFPKALDIGCGPGFFSVILALAGYQVTAVDYTEHMLDEARKNAALYGVSISFQQMDAQDLIFADESFDLIVSRNITWNLPEPEKAYSEWLRVLRPGGKLINADGNFYYYMGDKDYLPFYYSCTKNHTHLEGIDVSIINHIGENNPLARELRPAWDIRMALDLGAHSASGMVTEETLTDSIPPKRLIDRFTVVIEK